MKGNNESLFRVSTDRVVCLRESDEAVCFIDRRNIYGNVEFRANFKTEKFLFIEKSEKGSSNWISQVVECEFTVSQ